MQRLRSILAWLPLVVFLGITRSAGPEGVDWRQTYLWAGGLGGCGLALNLWARSTDWLFTGVNLWLATGAVCFLLGIYAPLNVFAELGPASMFVFAAVASAVAMVVGRFRASAFFFVACCICAALSYRLHGESMFYASTAPFVALYILQIFLQGPSAKEQP